MKCKYPDCSIKRAIFAFVKTDKDRFCSTHKKHDMVDIKNKKCEEAGCSKSPAFNIKGSKKAIYCSTHKKHDMVNVINKVCEEADCSKQPAFNTKGSKKAIYCSTHKKHDMVDVVSKQCEEAGCSKNPTFNIKGSKKAIYCATHKKHDMIDVISKRCVCCHMVSARSHYDDHCYGCFSFKHPEHPKVRNFKTKEQAIMSSIAKEYPDIILDKAISGGCSRKRPDGFIDLISHVIIVEVDENQHRGYDTSCDNKRTMEIYRDVAYRPVVFIRVNPDGYKVDGKKVNSGFSITKKTGNLKTHPRILNQRIKATLAAIERHSKAIPDRAITVESLFFDEYDVKCISSEFINLEI